ncbi:hypothetical protein AB6A40_001255 [Gnathostoma spinigerum]|uniref:RNA polymerase II elongation factor ELL N-terminal domain-containing protein n=1 Tax=Gnathostoma spinigerum TaxID=75299 RepID=A0ABD6EAV0_9BILA
MTAASPSVSPTAVAALDVLPLIADTAASCEQSAMMVKLTDESIAAIQKAQKARLPMKMRIDPQGGVIEIGTDSNLYKFRFTIQQIPGTPADAVVYDRVRGYRSTATLQSKIQVQATDKSFAETREKAQKLVEEEKRKATKDVTRGRRDQRPVTVKRTTNPVAIGAQRPSPSSSNFSKSHTSDSKSNAPKFPRALNGSAAGSRMRAELLRKPLRKRLVHLIVLGRYSTVDEIISSLKKDGLADDSPQEIGKARDIIEEVSESGKDNGHIQLKPSFYSEVDARWPWFNSDEKAIVRKILSGNSTNSSNFAPTRKSGMAPLTAPTLGGHSNNVSPEAIPTPPSTLAQQRTSTSFVPSRKASPKVSNMLCNSSNNKSPVLSTNTIPSTGSTSVSNVLDDLLPSSASATGKRKAHVSTAQVVPDKRPRPQSLSPPEDPTSANPSSSQSNQKRLHHRNLCNPTSREEARRLLKDSSSVGPEQHTRNGSSQNSSSASPLTKDSLPPTTNNTSDKHKSLHRQPDPVDRTASDERASAENTAVAISTTAQETYDWAKEFPEVRNFAEAERYYNIFTV